MFYIAANEILHTKFHVMPLMFRDQETVAFLLKELFIHMYI